MASKAHEALESLDLISLLHAFEEVLLFGKGSQYVTRSREIFIVTNDILDLIIKNNPSIYDEDDREIAEIVVNILATVNASNHLLNGDVIYMLMQFSDYMFCRASSRDEDKHKYLAEQLNAMYLDLCSKSEAIAAGM